MVLKLILFSILCLIGTHAKVPARQSLDGTWVGREKEYTYEYPGTVPGGVYQDMIDQQIIDDIFTFYHDEDTNWVGTIDWVYYYNFILDDDLLDYENVNLVFEGIDTFATIELNNVTIGTTNNMFVRYYFDVKKHLKTNGNVNTLTVWFDNAPKVASELYTEQLKKYKIPWECPPDDYHGTCHINMIRKMQASFSWDWGPSFPEIGIWKPVYLEAYDEASIRSLVVQSQDPKDDKNYELVIDTYFAPNQQGFINGSLKATIYLSEDKAIYKVFNVSEHIVEKGEFRSTVVLPVEKSDVQLWWPNGLGEQPLYRVGVAFTSSVDGSVVSRNVSTGIRFVELVQQPLDNGETFYLKVNGQPIFAKGSNEIPINILPYEGQNHKTIRSLLQAAKDVNMNMLRVWGGGVYESDYFYEVADEFGIMIWQDFMFACSLYPATEEFLSNVADEVDYNLKRIASHPSIVVYSGNNENEGALADNWYNTAALFDTYKADYVALYIDTIKANVDRILNGRAIYISSSPTNGNLTISEGYVGQSPSNQFWGDVHYYNYDSDPWDSNTFPVPRFCSEYGYQSYPFEDSWLTATNTTDDIDLSGKFFSWRQHHPDGNSQIQNLISINLKLPNATSLNYTNAFIYLSQVYAAQAIKVETEHYRRYRSYLTDNGRGYTMGALYWQLNDVWVAPTWSSIDFTGRWKMLHYFAANFFANVIVTGHLNANRELQLYTVNDNFNDIKNASVLVKIYNYSSTSFEPVYQDRISTNINASSSQLIQLIKTDDLLAEQKCDQNSCFFYFEVQDSSNAALGPVNYVFPGKLNNSTLPSSNVNIAKIDQVEMEHVFQITVSSDKIALFVWLDAHNIKGRFSDNGFLQVEANKTVYFYSEEPLVTVEQLGKVLTVTHLTDSVWQ
ncbi:hypothetical protein ABEB36_003777 [Hypothenemus hampei]|uniref:beta-mannosidase n=1 Tax=Hypothenemus hampei TaxID=57062 RepID=A0ABD1F130_HYPHA